MRSHPFKVALLTVLVFFLLLEGILRICGVKAKIPFYNSSGPFTVHPTLSWAFKPHFNGKWSGVDFQTNALGLRGKELASPKPEGEFRILVLGGSVSAGNAVGGTETYVGQLEAALQKEHKNVVLINGGVPGYSTQQELSFLRETGLSLKPDMLILDFAINDVLDGRVGEDGNKPRAHDTRPEFRASEAFLRLGPKPTMRGRFEEIVEDVPRYTSSFTMFRWMNNRLRTWMFPSGIVDFPRWLEKEVLAETPSALVEDSWKKTKIEIEEIDAISDELKIPLVLVMFPITEQVLLKQGHDRPQRVMKEFCDEQGIILVDLLPVYRKELGANASLKLFQDADHPSVKGHEIAADALKVDVLPLLKEHHGRGA